MAPRITSETQSALARLRYPALAGAYERGTLQAPAELFRREQSLDCASLHRHCLRVGFDPLFTRSPQDIVHLEVLNALTPAHFGKCQIYRLASYHGIMVPMFESWRLENPSTPLHVWNWDTHHDAYSGAQTSSTWALYLGRSSNTFVTHFPSDYSLDTALIRAPGEALALRPYVRGTPWQDLDVAKTAYERYRRFGGEVWVTIDLDHFFCSDSVKAMELPFVVPTKKQINAEVRSMIDFIAGHNLPISRVLACKSNLYVGLRGKVGESFIRDALLSVVRGFGLLGLLQAKMIDAAFFRRMLDDEETSV
jgi:hypothetical protein